MKTINIQPIEKKLEGNGTYLDLHSIFRTIQGEGPFAGEPAIFVRLAGCNLRCPSCDTDYTHNRMYTNYITILQHIQQLRKGYKVNLIVITGGEPFRQNISLLCAELLDKGFKVQVETNGTMAMSPHLPPSVVIVCAPKSGKVNENLRERIAAYKYVIQSGDVNPDDGLPIHVLDHSCGKGGVARPSHGRPVFVQPQDDGDEEKNKANLAETINSSLKFGHRLCIQMHKVIGVE